MRTRAILTTLPVILLIGLMGCGGSSGASDPATSNGDVITRANQNSFSLDARILAAREAPKAWIPASTAAQIDNDLQRIRSFSPAVADIHALPSEDPYSVLVEVPKIAGWAAKWSAGNVLTGVASIDSLSQTYKATSVNPVATFPDYITFHLTFTDPLATRYVAAAYKYADASIRNASINAIAGDGNNIYRNATTTQTDYLLSKGWGDCQAGCIQRHTWHFTLTPDGKITVSESGNPLQ